MKVVSGGWVETRKRVINNGLYCPLPKAWRYTRTPDAMQCGCEYSLYCKRGRENTGVSLYRKKDRTVDALIETVNMDSLSLTHSHTHTPQLSSPGYVSQTQTHTQQKIETEKQKSLDFSLLLSHSLDTFPLSELVTENGWSASHKNSNNNI